MKNYWASHKKELEQNYEKIKQSKPSTAIDGPAFLFSSHSPATDVELRSEVPPKSAVDKLVTRYFNSYDPAVQILHSPTFHKQLHNHWQDPSKTSIVWLGLLYSILCLAMQSYHKQGDEPPEWKGMQQQKQLLLNLADLAIRSDSRISCRIQTPYSAVSCELRLHEIIDIHNRNSYSLRPR